MILLLDNSHFNRSTPNIILWIYVSLCSVLSHAQVTKDLRDVFNNALISDTTSNLNRLHPITIVDYDQQNQKIKTNLKDLKPLTLKGTGRQSWFITQGEEASTIVEIKQVDTTSGWISLGHTYSGVLNLDEGETIEFFNPFINYSIIDNKPLFDPYPDYIHNNRIGYLQPSGIIKRAQNDFVLLTSVVFGAHKKRDLYYATSSDLEKWKFHPQKIIETNDLAFAKKNGNIFSTGNPIQLADNAFLVLLGIEKPSGKYSGAYMIINQDLKIIEPPTEIIVNQWQNKEIDYLPLSSIQFQDQYRILLYKKNKQEKTSELFEITTKDILKTLQHKIDIHPDNSIITSKFERGYLHGKTDDASYLIYNSKLHIMLGSEELPSEYLTSLNREYGLLLFENNKWIHDHRSPILINPINVDHKYPEYSWANDHLGGFISPILKNNYLYVFVAFGTDNPDYYISGIKIKTE